MRQAIESALARLRAGAVNPAHVEAWIRDANVTGCDVDKMAERGDDAWLRIVMNAAAIVNAVPPRESEALAHKWSVTA